MYPQQLQQSISQFVGHPWPLFVFWPFFALIILWSLIWKGAALWKAARLGHKGWFIALLVINTAGVLEIIYIFAVARKKERHTAHIDRQQISG